MSRPFINHVHIKNYTNTICLLLDYYTIYRIFKFYLYYKNISSYHQSPIYYIIFITLYYNIFINIIFITLKFWWILFLLYIYICLLLKYPLGQVKSIYTGYSYLYTQKECNPVNFSNKTFCSIYRYVLL